MKRITRVCAMTVALLILFCCVSYAAGGSSVIVRPNLIHIGTNFNGAELDVTGQIPEDCRAVIRLLGESESKHFKKKGRALGVLWMNLSTVELHDVPNVFLIGTDGDGNAVLHGPGLGFDSVKGQTGDLIFNEFIKLMQQDGLYQVQKGIVRYHPAQDDSKAFEAKLSVPSALHKGIYTVEVLAVRDGSVISRASHDVHAELTGFPALLSVVAYDHSLMYGIVAVIIAIMAGLGMTLLFKEKGGVH